MMSSSNDYATALFMLAAENDLVGTIYDDLSVIKKVFAENPEYSLLITSPSIPKSERMEVIDSAFKGSLNQYTINFLKVLCEHNKISTLSECIKVYKQLKKSAENRVTAKVYTAVPLSDEQTEKLKEKLQAKFGATVNIKPVVDKKMLGGVKVEIDGKVIDGSIKKQLHDIKEVISG